MKTLSTLAALFGGASLAMGQANDECAMAIPLSTGLTAYDTTGATTSAPAWGCATGGADIWYSFTAPDASDYFFQTCLGTGYDSALELFSGTCGALLSIDCNDDTCGTRSRVTLTNPIPGNTYYLRIGGWNSSTGTGMINVIADAPVFNPGNGHYYQAFLGNIDWGSAQATAQGMVFMGAQGHLATVADQAEQDFLLTLGADRPWLGGFQDVNDPNYMEPGGGWGWVTGEPFTYVNWQPGEPNDNPPNEDAIEMFGSGVWNDIASSNNSTDGYIVEWEPTGSVGTNYCGPAIPNSTGQAAVMSGSGSALVALNNLTLTADLLPTGQFGYFLVGQTQGFFNPPGSQGIICLMGNIGRYNAVPDIITGPTGSLLVDWNTVPVNPPTAGLPGETWNFQCWFRDNNPGQTSNFTDGLQVLLQ